MRILIVHPVMTFLGGGERLCCDTIRALLSDGHDLTILSSNFEPEKLEEFFGYRHFPFRLHYQQQISRVGLVLALYRDSKVSLDLEWKRPSKLLYPACNMVKATSKRDLVVTAARAIPGKRLELFWAIARIRPEYE